MSEEKQILDYIENLSGNVYPTLSVFKKNLNANINAAIEKYRRRRRNVNAMLIQMLEEGEWHAALLKSAALVYAEKPITTIQGAIDALQAHTETIDKDAEVQREILRKLTA